VVPDSNYNSAVPVLIGTNILSSFIDQLQGTYGDKYLQDAHLFTSVYMALRCLTLRELQMYPCSILLLLHTSVCSVYVLVVVHKGFYVVIRIRFWLICCMVRHRIDLTNDLPFKQKHRHIPPTMYEDVRDHIHQLLASGIIRQSHSPWTSNVVLCRKKDGKLRMCVDYLQLNTNTIKDAHALPRIEEINDIRCPRRVRLSDDSTSQ
jgi:hypothetical protein